MVSPLKSLELFSNAVRAKEIITLLVKHGFGDLLKGLHLPRGWIERMIPSEDRGATIWERLRVLLEELGPTFVKFGQVLSTRPDVLPQPMIDELKKLRSQVKPVPYEEMEPAIEADLGGPVGEFFDEFDTTPVACGSVGQVYRAKMKITGEPVAIKVQRPNIRKAIVSDLEIIGWLVRQLHERIDELRPYDLPSVVESSGKGILEELDFTIEARNAMVFNEKNPYEKIFAPKVYDQFTGPRLMVWEWVEGVSPADVTLSPEMGREVAELGARSVFHQILVSGFFHADPHGGNILLTADGRLCFIDWGLAGQLTSTMRYFLADLFAGIADNNPEKIVRVVMSAVGAKQRVDRQQLEQQVTVVLGRYLAQPERDQSMGRIMLELLFIFGSNGVFLARDFSLLSKAILSIEEIARHLDPDFDLKRAGMPFMRKLLRERWNPLNIGRRSLWSAQSYFGFLRNLPMEIQRFLRHLEDGEIKIRMEHVGLTELSNSWNSGVNRLTLAIITAALLLSSSIIISTTVGDDPDIFDLYRMPTLIGTFGFKVSAIFGLWLMWDVVRHGKHR